MSLGKVTTEQRKPQNQIINRQMRRTQMVKRELIEKLLEEQARTQASLQVEPLPAGAAMPIASTKQNWLARFFQKLRLVRA